MKKNKTLKTVNAEMICCTKEQLFDVAQNIEKMLESVAEMIYEVENGSITNQEMTEILIELEGKLNNTYMAIGEELDHSVAMSFKQKAQANKKKVKM